MSRLLRLLPRLRLQVLPSPTAQAREERLAQVGRRLDLSSIALELGASMEERRDGFRIYIGADRRKAVKA